MNKQGAIASFETDADAKQAGYRTRLTAEEADKLMHENRHERRARLAEMRREKRRAMRSRRP